MTDLTQISPAIQADIPALAEVVVQCEAQDPLVSLWYGSCDLNIKRELPGVVLLSNLENPHVRLFKATKKEKVVGYGSLWYSQGDIQYPVILRGSSYEGMNEELYMAAKNEMAKKRKQFLDGERHIIITMRVLPQHDGEGVGFAMLRWAFTHFALETETIWVSEPRSETRVYSEFGWKTVDFINIDLPKWAKDGQGGIYQAQCMLRRPGKLEGTDNKAETDNWPR